MLGIQPHQSKTLVACRSLFLGVHGIVDFVLAAHSALDFHSRPVLAQLATKPKPARKPLRVARSRSTRSPARRGCDPRQI
jgi:hypothetical protein